jgi:phenylpyruvate tautomerase PptA (4-oxalocrotonate tautomerase family)
MPRWTFYLREGVLPAEDMQRIASAVTELYVEMVGMPKFFVNVFFNEYPTGKFFSGGMADHNSVFFHIDHAARPFNSEEERLFFLDRAISIVRPIFDGKVKKWEFNVYEHPFHNWRINGMVPPMKDPEMMKLWVNKDKPIQY